MFKAMKGKIFATCGDGLGFKISQFGIILNEKDGKSSSIRPRVFKIKYLGDDIKDLKTDEYIIVEHGRWTEGFDMKGEDEKLYMIDPKGVMLTMGKKWYDEDPHRVKIVSEHEDIV